MTDSRETEQDPLQLLKKFITNNLKLQLLDEKNNVVDTLRDATYIQFDSFEPIDKNKPTLFKGQSQKGYPLSILYHATITKDLEFPKYNEDATNKKLTERLNFTERKHWVAYLNGHSALLNDLDKNIYGKTSEKRRHDNSADSDHQNAVEIKRQKKARFDSDKIWMEIYQKEYQATSNWPWEESLESKDKEQDYSAFIQLADTHFLKRNHALIPQDKSRNLESYAKTHYRPDVKQSQKPPRNPLIIVPQSPSAFITMFNIKQLLQDARYEDQAILRNSNKKDNTVTIIRNGKEYEFTDQVENFQQADWNRVVCVITDGSEWLFKKYCWKTPEDTFKNVPGVYFKYTHDEVKKNVIFWRNIYYINIHQNLRHKDAEAYTEFWNIVEKARRY
ncbi:21466_t:CDS:2 [Dentiscutata erythropus]|uniref:21466_t:CDS:1 n=1 Tax=Dentiscutata erythropus TaxID=1348616 RepID=A0A9N8ZE08_9GLOM|nr:21466_t:CDS:2 [Dentiscutata erythropus]